jgi:poly-gamma-glutamate synthesis protein (capsule biosynthesis protein)
MPVARTRGRLVIHAVGDVNFALSHNSVFAAEGYDIAWEGVDGLFTRDHLTIINLECSPSEVGRVADPNKKWSFRCPIAALAPMRAAGIDVANLANNHAGDMGPAALLDGRANLIAVGIDPVGAGRDLDEAGLPAVVEVEGWTVAVVGLSRISGGPGWYARSGSPGVAPAEAATIAESIGAAESQADLVIVTVHWGDGGSGVPNPADRDRARAMIAAGADVIIGHHPHVLQPLEMIDGVPVFWSLGNFVWVRHGIADRDVTAVAEIVVESDGTRIGRLIPARIASHGRPILMGRPDPSLWTRWHPPE